MSKHPPTKTINWLRLAISIAACQAAGLVGSLFTFSAINNWYIYLNKPSFNPPNWLFGPVWTILYTLMGISLYLIWQKGIKYKKVKQAAGIFVLHLVINALWSIIFFGFHQLLLSLFVIGLLLALIVILIRRFYPIQPWAAYLLVPYLSWVSFAMVLNFELWRLN
jgi:tryptophan-rich sensory protein